MTKSERPIEPERPDRADVLERMRARAERDGIRLTDEEILDATDADKR